MPEPPKLTNSMTRVLRIPHLLCCCSLHSYYFYIVLFMMGQLLFSSASSDTMYHSMGNTTMNMNVTDWDETLAPYPEKDSIVVEVIGGIVGSLSLNAFLIVGVVNKRPCLLLPWLILSGLGLVLFVILLLINIFLFFSPPKTTWTVLLFLIMVLLCVFGFYYFLVVLIYYKEIRAELRGNVDNDLPSRFGTGFRSHSREPPPPSLEGLEFQNFHALPL
ncbi:uncharacterized protein LOC143024269 isoform X2 [Oratosquilla oratoria]|uniref:uncharacterized protein LOC143024269 isoform X2 n=1 Tax=Oratosquilla oratoria TaxID=337810 RepID=UPI003F75AC56